MHTISNSFLRVDLASRGAEIQSIRSRSGAEWLWNGDPAWWTGRAPLLFPVVGRSPEGRVTIEGRSYPMAPHGFARISDYRVDELGKDAIRFRLGPDDRTRAAFPFDFLLSITYRLEGACLAVTATVQNRDRRAMPFQFGYHPAFVWPLPGSDGRVHRVELDNRGEPPLWRLGPDGLLAEGAASSPFRAGILVPQPEMFAQDAMLFPEGAGEVIRFTAESGASVEMRVRNLPNFALWQKPGAPYLCLEPWRGTAPCKADGAALETRNGAAVLSPGEEMAFTMELRFQEPG